MKTISPIAIIALFLAICAITAPHAKVARLIEIKSDSVIVQNAKALGMLNLNDSSWVVIDTIPCYSEAKTSNNIFKSILGIRIDKDYIDCATCHRTKGDPTGGRGTCTIVRPFAVEVRE